ncbi:MAG: phosphoribosyltransferase family protein [Kineosporiaceae bacterium]
MRFANRSDAGRRLAGTIVALGLRDVVVVGLPRGGVPVAYEVARALCAPLDVIVVRKLRAPFQPELAMGAVGEDGARVINDAVFARTGISDRKLAEIEARERAEVRRQARRFRDGRPRIPLAGRTVVVVDDGIATGSTARAACWIARAQGAARVVLAVPVASQGVERRMRPDADEVVCLATPWDFLAVGQVYDDFSEVDDEQVEELLRRAGDATFDASTMLDAPTTPDASTTRGQPREADPPARDEEISLPAGGVRLSGEISLPAGAAGVVLFAHGSGSSRHSPRNRYVAGVLAGAGLGQLLFDLLTPGEEQDRANVFDIGLLADRLLDVTLWLRRQPDTRQLRIGYFGASTGAAAALCAAADPRCDVAAIVSRGGRPDLAGDKLGLVRAPTLLIVGGDDRVVLDLNRSAQRRLRCENRLDVVPGATHLFEEPGTLERVAELAADWFTTHLSPGAA